MTMTSIKFKVTREDSVPTSGGVSGELLTPHLLAPRNSLTSATEYTTRKRRPMTLKIMPRLSLPTQSTSAPASTTDSEWPPVRSSSMKHRTYDYNVLVAYFATPGQSQSTEAL